MNAEVALGVLWGALAGLALGVLFFVGLWATVTRVGRARAAGGVLVASFLLRLALLAGGLYLVSRGGQWPLIGALVGIFVARPLVTRLVVKPGAGATDASAVDAPAKEAAR